MIDYPDLPTENSSQMPLQFATVNEDYDTDTCSCDENDNSDTDNGPVRSEISEVDVQRAAAIWLLKSTECHHRECH